MFEIVTKHLRKLSNPWRIAFTPVDKIPGVK